MRPYPANASDLAVRLHFAALWALCSYRPGGTGSTARGAVQSLGALKDSHIDLGASKSVPLLSSSQRSGEHDWKHRASWKVRDARLIYDFTAGFSLHEQQAADLAHAFNFQHVRGIFLC